MMKRDMLLGTRCREGRTGVSSRPALSCRHQTPSRGPKFCRVLGEGLLSLTLLYGQFLVWS